MVETLRSSGVANYIEFKPLDSFLCGERTTPSEAAAAGAASTGSSSSSRLKRVPCGKADIFQSADIPLIQKRQLMKFLQTCAGLQAELEPTVSQQPQARASPDAAPIVSGEAAASAAEGSFTEFLARQRLAPALADMILYAILQLTGPPAAGGGGAGAAAAAATMPSAADGVRAINKHLRSLGVYGSTAYLTCVYGSSEMPQGFCRLCAVWGGVYMLNSGTLSLELEEDESSGGKEVRAVIGPEGGQRIECGSLVLNADTRLPRTSSGGSTVAAASEAIGGISRCVCILDGPLLVTTSAPAAAAADTDGAGSTNSTQSPPASLAILFPPTAEGSSTISRAGSTIYAHQMDADVGVCPRGKVLLHMSAMSQDGYTPEELLKPALDSLLKEQAALATQGADLPTRRHHICRTLTQRLRRRSLNTKRCHSLPPLSPPPSYTYRVRRITSTATRGAYRYRAEGIRQSRTCGGRGGICRRNRQGDRRC